MRLALDAMGGDHAPASPVEGALLFARQFPQHQVVLVGDEAQLRAAVPNKQPLPANIFIRHATEVIGMDEHPGQALRKKKDSSLRVCFELARQEEVAAVVSAGNSGAVMAGALFVLGRLPGVERPAIATLFPALRGGRCLLLDAGANTECTPVYLAQFAVMGEAYVRKLMGVAKPRVAVLSNGEEPSKGTQLTRDTLALLTRSNLDFRGYVEGKDIFAGEADVIVTDGFTGNVVLKTSEGTAMGMVALIKQAIEKAGLPEKIGALLLKPTLGGLKKMVDYAEYGGAPLLGVDGVGIVAHGRSNPYAVMNALKAALHTAEAQLRDELAAAIEASSAWLPARQTKRGRDQGAEVVTD